MVSLITSVDTFMEEDDNDTRYIPVHVALCMWTSLLLPYYVCCLSLNLRERNTPYYSITPSIIKTKVFITSFHFVLRYKKKSTIVFRFITHPPYWPIIPSILYTKSIHCNFSFHIKGKKSIVISTFITKYPHTEPSFHSYLKIKYTIKVCLLY